jgi:transposase
MAERLRKAGKAFKVIVTACMRKLLVTLNQRVKTDTTYNASLNVSATSFLHSARWFNFI